MPNSTPETKPTDRRRSVRLERDRLAAMKSPPLAVRMPSGGATDADSRPSLRTAAGRLERDRLADNPEFNLPEGQETEGDKETFGSENPEETGGREGSRPNPSQSAAGLAQIRWRLTFWSKAILGWWLFLPLLTVVFHKLAADRKISEAVKGFRQAAGPALQAIPHARLTMFVLRFIDLLLIVEWIVIITLILLIGMIYLALAALISMAAYCLTSPIQCLSMGWASIF